jgi:hypothetical protein
MGLFNRKKDAAPQATPSTTEKATTQEGARRFGFGRSKALAVPEPLATPPAPWAPEGSAAQGSAGTSALTSRRNSLSSVRSSVLMELKYEAMVNHLFQQQCSNYSTILLDMMEANA